MRSIQDIKQDLRNPINRMRKMDFSKPRDHRRISDFIRAIFITSKTCCKLYEELLTNINVGFVLRIDPDNIASPDVPEGVFAIFAFSATGMRITILKTSIQHLYNLQDPQWGLVPPLQLTFDDLEFNTDHSLEQVCKLLEDAIDLSLEVAPTA